MCTFGAGFITPPPGLDLFVGSGPSRESMLTIAVRAVAFVIFMLLGTLLIAYVPEVVTSLLPDIYR